MEHADLAPALVYFVIELHGVNNLLLIVDVVKIKGESTEGAHLRFGIGNKGRVDGVYHLGTGKNRTGKSYVNFTVRIPRFPAFSSLCIPRTAQISVRLSGCLSTVGCNSANLRERKSSPRFPDACCAVHARCPHTARRTRAIISEQAFEVR